MRQTTLATLLALCIATAGCSGTGPTDTTTAQPTTTTAPVGTIATADVTPTDADVRLVVEYNAVAVDQLPTDPPTGADDGRAWVLVKMRVTNTGSTPHELTNHQYIFESAGTTYESVRVTEPWMLGHPRGETLAPGELAQGWTVFHAPADPVEGTLTVRNTNSQTYHVTFTPNASLSTTVPD